MTAGDRIRRARNDMGMTQAELGKIADVNKTTINKYELNLIANIPPNKLLAISTALSVSPSYLMGWEECSIESDIERGIIVAYRQSSDEIKRAVRKILEVE